jgi:hypothetical protein
LHAIVCFRHRTRNLLLGLLVAFSLALPALAADKHAKPKQNGVESAGMYSNYVMKVSRRSTSIWAKLARSAKPN